MPTYDADLIVIGSGAGGLSAAVAAARAGSRVLVLEQHYVPGGWCHNFVKDGFTFCPGVHYIGRLQEGGETRVFYEGLGVANDLVFFEQNPDAYEHCDIAGTKFNYPNSLPGLEERLYQHFPKSRAGIREYMFILNRLVEQLPFIFEVESWKDKLTVPYRTRHIGRYGLFSLKQTLEARIDDPVLRAVLSVQCGDQGLPPGKTMMLLHAALARHYEHGGFYPKGGGGAIARAMVKTLKAAGGKIKLGARVEKIIVEGARPKVVGVRLSSGEELRCSQLISNADPQQTYLGMIGGEHLSKRLLRRLAKARYSISSLHLFLGINTDPRNLGLDSGNIWYARTPDFDAIFRKAQDPTLYEDDEFDGCFISAPTQKDPTSYNGRAHALEAVTFVSYDPFRPFSASKTEAREEGYQRLKEKITAMFLKTIEHALPGIGKHIVFCELGTPLTNSHYINCSEGSVYGTEKSYMQIGPFSYRAKTEIEGLYLAGASTSAHGVSGAAMSGVEAAAAALKCKSASLLNAKGQALRVYSAEDRHSWAPDITAMVERKRMRAETQANDTNLDV